MRCRKIKRNIEEFMDGTLSEKKRVWKLFPGLVSCSKQYYERVKKYKGGIWDA